jgi:hypothetical protein
MKTQKKRKEYLSALLFIGALLMLSFEAGPGDYWLLRQSLVTMPAIIMLGALAYISNKKNPSHECDLQE